MSNHSMKYEDIIKDKRIKNYMNPDFKYRHRTPVIVCDYQGWKAYNMDEYQLKIQKDVENMTDKELLEEIQACLSPHVESISDFNKNYENTCNKSWTDIVAMLRLRLSKCQQEKMKRDAYSRDPYKIIDILNKEGFDVRTLPEMNHEIFGKKVIDKESYIMFMTGYCHIVVGGQRFFGNTKTGVCMLRMYKFMQDIGKYHICGNSYSFMYEDGWENDLPKFLEEKVIEHEHPYCQKCGNAMYVQIAYYPKIKDYCEVWKCGNSKKKCRTKYRYAENCVILSRAFSHIGRKAI